MMLYLWYLIILANLMLFSLWTTLLFYRLMPDLESTIFFTWISLALSLLQILGVTLASNHLWKWSEFLEKKRLARIAMTLLLIPNLLLPLLVTNRLTFSIKPTELDSPHPSQLPFTIAPNIASPAWQPISSMNMEFEALLKGTTLQLEAHNLFRKGKSDVVHQKLMAAAVEYESAGDIESIINVYSNLQYFHRIGMNSDPSQARFVLGYDIQITYLNRKLVHEQLDGISGLPKSENHKRAENMYREAWNLFQVGKFCQDKLLLAEMKQFFIEQDLSLELDQIDMLNRVCSIEFKTTQKDTNENDYSSTNINVLSDDSLAAEQYLNAKESYNQSDWQTALSLFTNALNSFKAQNHLRGIAHTMTELGNTHLRLQDYSEARNYYEDAIALFNYLNDEQSQAVAHHDLALANTLDLNPNFEKAKSEFDLAIIRWNTTSTDSIEEFYSSFGYGYMLWQAGNRAQAIDIFTKLQLRMQAFLSTGTAHEVNGDIYMNLGVIYFEQEDYPNASRVFESAWNEYHSLSNIRKKIQVQYNIGLTQEKRQNFEIALNTFQQVADTANKNELQDIRGFANEQITSIRGHLPAQQGVPFYMWSIVTLSGILLALILRFTKNYWTRTYFAEIEPNLMQLDEMNKQDDSVL